MQWRGVLPEFLHSHDLADETIVARDVLDPVIITIQTEPHHAQHQNVPERHARAAGMRELAAQHFFLQKVENAPIDFRRAEDPLQPGQDGSQFVTAFERNHDLLDGRLPQVGVGFESLAHLAGSCTNVPR